VERKLLEDGCDDVFILSSRILDKEEVGKEHEIGEEDEKWEMVILVGWLVDCCLVDSK